MRRLVVASLLLVVAGCKGRTELVFGFATDLKAKNQIDHVAFQVYNAPSQVIEVSADWDLADVPAGQYELPGSYGVYTDNGAEPTLQVDFVGSLAGEEILRREAVLSPVAGKTLFMRMTLVGECDEVKGTHCPGGQVCVEGVCRASDVANATLPEYHKGAEGKIECNSGTQFVVSSTGTPLEPTGTCAANQFCQEGTCYDNPPGTTQAIGTTDWTTTPTDVTTTVHGVFTTSDGDVFGVGEHGIILHAPAGGGAIVDETFDPDHTLWGVWGTSASDLWAVGSDGVVLHRGNAGWAAETGVPPATRLSAVWGAGGELWAVGRQADGGATILHRAPTGSWRAETLPGATGELAALWGSSGSDVWAVGAGFGIVHFDGNAWRTGPAAPDGATADLLAVGGSGRGDVYFVGRGGLVAHLGADGTLATQPSPKPFDLYAVWASGPEDIYAVGDYGLILHSTGDGAWSVQESGTRDPLFAVDGSGPANVFAAGRVGTILHFGAGGGTPPDMSPPNACSAAADCGTRCAGGMLTVRACDLGQCSDLPPAACAGGYQCANATDCASSCAADADCQADYFCDATSHCQARKAQGDTCNADAGGECKTPDCHVCRDGFYCTDHVCCDTPAAQCGGCMHCSAPSGTCVNADANTDPHNYCPASTDECQAATCNGTGSCARPNATACGVDMCSGNQLTKHTCQNGACTAASPTTCAGGTNCASDGKTCVGKCAQDSDCTQAGVGAYCDKNGDCQPRKAAAGTCNLAAGGDCKVAGCGECQSGLSCADGVCCNQACGGACQACDVAGKVGQCTTLTSGQPHHGLPCMGAGTPTCGGYCNGDPTTCYVPPATTKVVKATCSSRDVLTGATYCDGSGHVGSAGAAVSCDPYACQQSGSSAMDDSCLKQCATVAQCANDKLACDSNKRCGLPDGSQCKPSAPADCASDICWLSPKNIGICCGATCGPQCDPKDANHASELAPDCSTGACNYITVACSGAYACRPDTGVCSTVCRCDDNKLAGVPCASADCRVNTLCRGVRVAGGTGTNCD